MPTGSDHPAAGRGDAEAARWASLATAVRAVGSAITPPAPLEREVTGFDPDADLARRAERWGHVLPDGTLSALARFAAGLAAAESAAWRDDRPHHATRAFEDRRFLAADRIVHWAVPWLDAAGRCHPAVRAEAMGARDLLLDLADDLRVAPALAGTEGLVPPGEDAFGPLGGGDGTGGGLLRLGSGLVIFGATLSSLRGRPLAGRRMDPGWMREAAFRRDLVSLFEAAAVRWSSLADARPGSARLWIDLGGRATATAARLGGS